MIIYWMWKYERNKIINYNVNIIYMYIIIVCVLCMYVCILCTCMYVCVLCMYVCVSGRAVATAYLGMALVFMGFGRFQVSETAIKQPQNLKLMWEMQSTGWSDPSQSIRCLQIWNRNLWYFVSVLR